MSRTSHRNALGATLRGSVPALAAAVTLAALVGGAIGTPDTTAGPPPVPASACAPATLSDSPASGTTPLLVNFSVQISSSTVPTYAWDFGDGTFYNGSGPLFASPVHRYSAPGVYNVTVVVRSSAGSSVCSTVVTATAAAFVAVAGASPTSGTAPLNVTFTAGIEGGTGTYTDAIWWFDDGNNGSGLTVTYTFVAAGHYHVLLNVTDSAGAAARASVWVNVSSATSVPGGQPSGAPGFALGGTVLVAGAIAAGIALVVGVALMLGRRSSRAGDRPVSPTSGGPPASVVGTSIGRSPPHATPLQAPTGALADTPAGAVPGTDPGRPRPLPEPPTETLRLSQRVIVHLAQQGALPDDAVATEGFTQGGMAAALGVPQNRLSNVLRRLRDAGALRDDVRHVSGRARRMKVYRLTPLGERLARDLRRRAKAAASRSARALRPPP